MNTVGKNKEYIGVCMRISRNTGHSFKTVVSNYFKLIEEGMEVDEALDALEDYYMESKSILEK